jgi:rod shape determining protein RodA
MTKIKEVKTTALFLKENYKAFLAVFCLALFGIVNQLGMGETRGYFFKNVLWHVIGIVIFVGVTFLTDYRKLTLKILWLFYGVVMFLLSLTLITKGRWLHLGFINIQPSEFLKPVLVLVVSKIVSKEVSEILDNRTLLKLVVIVYIPLFIVLLKDLDFAFIMGFTFFVYFLFLGVRKKLVVIFGIICLALGIIGGPFVWKELKPHQRGRIYAYLYPEKYARTWAYQLGQSLIAIGSGGIKGQGFREGWSTRLNYLPAKTTDLAFSVWAESWGFIGATLVLLVYGYLIWFCISISESARDWFGKYLCFGVALILLFQVFFNVGGVTGLLPMTSIPFPFLSYGGSITITVYFLLSLVFNVAFKRYFFK